MVMIVIIVSGIVIVITAYSVVVAIQTERAVIGTVDVRIVAIIVLHILLAHLHISVLVIRVIISLGEKSVISLASVTPITELLFSVKLVSQHNSDIFRQVDRILDVIGTASVCSAIRTILGWTKSQNNNIVDDHRAVFSCFHGSLGETLHGLAFGVLERISGVVHPVVFVDIVIIFVFVFLLLDRVVTGILHATGQGHAQFIELLLILFERNGFVQESLFQRVLCGWDTLLSENIPLEGSLRW
mmetsp:Transcript_18196/g.45220  ORF Transcript_18196/g.45220 Transcript_18196/m.45220 type:complete len:243 (-) Transcript_18196:87-815(-)